MTDAQLVVLSKMQVASIQKALHVKRLLTATNCIYMSTNATGLKDFVGHGGPVMPQARLL
jgi:hypothetical protein